VHAPPTIFDTAKVSARGRPCFTVPLPGSERMSLRWSFSSTKYGPSVSAGLTMHEGTPATPDADAAVVADALPAAAVAADVPTVLEEPDPLGAQAARNAAAPVAPKRARASRLVRIRPTRTSSLSICAVGVRVMWILPGLEAVSSVRGPVRLRASTFRPGYAMEVAPNGADRWTTGGGRPRSSHGCARKPLERFGRGNWCDERERPGPSRRPDNHWVLLPVRSC
jgi:hypothetical protein